MKKDYDERALLFNTLMIQTASDDETRMAAYINKFLDDHNIWHYSDKAGNIYAIKGESQSVYPCVVSHMDTVHDLFEKFKIYSMIENPDKWIAIDEKTGNQVGIGGDDKCGVFMCLSMLLEFDTMKCVFFTQEEIGCIGSGMCEMDFFKDVSLVLQADRRGNNDFINNSNGEQLFGRSFKKKIKHILWSYGYDYNTGTVTDVGELKSQGLNVACANVSCGYYNAHSDDEYIIYSEVMHCRDLFIDIISNVGAEKNVHKRQPRTYTNYGRSNYGYGSSYYNGSSWNNNSYTPGKKYNIDTYAGGKKVYTVKGVDASESLLEGVEFTPGQHLSKMGANKSYTIDKWTDGDWASWYDAVYADHNYVDERSGDDYEDTGWDYSVKDLMGFSKTKALEDLKIPKEFDEQKNVSSFHEDNKAIVRSLLTEPKYCLDCNDFIMPGQNIENQLQVCRKCYQYAIEAGLSHSDIIHSYKI